MSLSLRKKYLMSLKQASQHEPIYGVSGLYQSDPALTRTDDAVGMSWSMVNNEIVSDFDNVFPYNEMVRETVDGNVMVYVPAIYWRFTKNVDGYIASVAVSKSPFIANNGEVVGYTDAFYYSAYNGSVENSKLVSKTGKAVQYQTWHSQFRTYAQANGTGYQLPDLEHLRILQMLWLIEFATKNSEAVMWGLAGYGNTNTGATDNLTKPSGQTGYRGSMRWHYIEDLVGNGYDFIDGIYGLYVTDNPSQFGQQAGISFTGTNITDSYELSALGFADESKPLLIVPKECVSNNSYNTYFCDANKMESGNNSYFYGSAETSMSSGLFYMYKKTGGGTEAYLTSRIMKRIS